MSQGAPHLLHDRIERQLAEALHRMAPGLPDLPAAEIRWHLPGAPSQADLSTNLPFLASRRLHRPAKAIADALAAVLRDGDLAEDAQAGGGGFVNVVLRPERLQDVLTERFGGQGDGVAVPVPVCAAPEHKRAALVAEAVERLLLCCPECAEGVGGILVADATEDGPAPPGWEVIRCHGPRRLPVPLPDPVRFLLLDTPPGVPVRPDASPPAAFSRSDPLFALHYAYARCRSVARHAAGLGMLPIPASSEAPSPLVATPEERGLMRRLAAWPVAVRAAARAREPHRVAFFLKGLAADFDLVWNHGREGANLRFLEPEEADATRARLALLSATERVIRSGLALLGLEPVEEIR